MKLNRRKKAKELPNALAWNVLFKREFPKELRGYGKREQVPHPLHLNSKTFMFLRKNMNVENGRSLQADILSAYNLSCIFNQQEVERWIKTQGFNSINSESIHDSFIGANYLLKLSSKWKSFLIKNPDLKDYIQFFPYFEKEFGRTPKNKKEFLEGVAKYHYYNVEDIEVAQIAKGLKLNQRTFEMYQRFFQTNPKKKTSSLPAVTVKKGNYTFEKMDDFDKRGPFLGLYTDCCQHLENAGSSCAIAGWTDSESGFYIIKKGNEIVAQSWAWRGKEGELCFDSIEGLGSVNIEAIALLYKKAARKLLGKLGVTKVTVGDTSYGLTPKIEEIISKGSCKAAKMIKEVSYSDANNQWLLAE